MTFRLAQLLRVRGLQQDAAAATAVRASAAASVVRRESAQRHAALSASDLGTKGQLAFAAAVAARSASTHLYTDSLALVTEAEEEEAAARAELAAARRRVRSLERLAERAARAATEAELRAEQALIDEHAGRTAGAPDDLPTLEPAP